MRRSLSLILIVILLLSLSACGKGKLQKTETEVVEAVVTAVWRSRARCGITVEYGGVRNDIDNAALFDAYQNNLGSTLTCYLIIRTYEYETTGYLVYNADLNKGKEFAE